MANPSDAALLESIVRLGHSLDLYVIAEGIETIEELRLLNAHGCDGLQGYLFSRPMPADLVPEFVAAFRAPEVEEWSERSEGRSASADLDR